jgi:hypothetical protein
VGGGGGRDGGGHIKAEQATPRARDEGKEVERAARGVREDQGEGADGQQRQDQKQKRRLVRSFIDDEVMVDGEDDDDEYEDSEDDGEGDEEEEGEDDADDDEDEDEDTYSTTSSESSFEGDDLGMDPSEWQTWVSDSWHFFV